MQTLLIGHSPDADDAFMFYALAREIVTIPGYRVDHVMADIQTLNQKARQGELPVTAISAAVYPQVAHRYRIMSCGASVGRNYGPILLAPQPMTVSDLAHKRIAVPGDFTTAYLLLRLFVTAPFQPVQLGFDQVIDAVQSGRADAAVIIHEGQLTWQKTGLHMVLDLGRAWMDDTGLPIPLGLDVIARRLGDETMHTITRALKDSIVYARAHEDDALDYAMQFGRGIDRETCRAFVRMYVNEDTVDMGDEGRKALEELFGRAVRTGIITENPKMDLIDV
jgi:1,4-dihydroxy-6-naphthoate synthase